MCWVSTHIHWGQSVKKTTSDLICNIENTVCYFIWSTLQLLTRLWIIFCYCIDYLTVKSPTKVFVASCPLYIKICWTLNLNCISVWEPCKCEHRTLDRSDILFKLEEKQREEITEWLHIQYSHPHHHLTTAKITSLCCMSQICGRAGLVYVAVIV